MPWLPRWFVALTMSVLCTARSCWPVGAIGREMGIELRFEVGLGLAGAPVEGWSIISQPTLPGAWGHRCNPLEGVERDVLARGRAGGLWSLPRGGLRQRGTGCRSRRRSACTLHVVALSCCHTAPRPVWSSAGHLAVSWSEAAWCSGDTWLRCRLRPTQRGKRRIASHRVGLGRLFKAGHVGESASRARSGSAGLLQGPQSYTRHTRSSRTITPVL